MKKYFLLIPFITVLWTCSENKNPSQSLNSPPVINEIIANPSQPNSGQIVTLNAIATDSDGDNLTYNWSVSAGQLDGDGIGNPIQWIAPEFGGEINIICAVSDGKEVAIKNIAIIVNYYYGILKGYIYDDYTKKSLRAYIYIEDRRVETADVGGYYEFNELEIGNHIINVVPHKSEFQTYVDTIEIIGGENYLDIYLKISRVIYSGTIYADSSTSTIGGAQIAFGPYFDSTEPTTDNRVSDGRWSIVLNDLDVGQTYNFQISKGGFQTYSDSLTIIGTDTSFVTYLKPE